MLSKQDSLENLDKILPFLVHPNNWIRNAAIEFVKILSDPATGILSLAETYCLVKPKLKKFLKKGQKVFQIYGSDLTESKLTPPLSRDQYDKEVQGQKIAQNRLVIQDSNLSNEDKMAKALLQETLFFTSEYHKNFKRE